MNSASKVLCRFLIAKNARQLYSAASLVVTLREESFYRGFPFQRVYADHPKEKSVGLYAW
jgi:hypothetical protein